MFRVPIEKLAAYLCQFASGPPEHSRVAVVDVPPARAVPLLSSAVRTRPDLVTQHDASGVEQLGRRVVGHSAAGARSALNCVQYGRRVARVQTSWPRIRLRSSAAELGANRSYRVQDARESAYTAEVLLPKVEAAGSSPVSRSIDTYSKKRHHPSRGTATTLTPPPWTVCALIRSKSPPSSLVRSVRVTERQRAVSSGQVGRRDGPPGLDQERRAGQVVAQVGGGVAEMPRLTAAEQLFLAASPGDYRCRQRSHRPPSAPEGRSTDPPRNRCGTVRRPAWR